MSRLGSWLKGGAVLALTLFGASSWAGLEPSRSDPSGYSFDLAFPRAALEQVLVEGRPYGRLALPGWPSTSEPGRPSLPYLTALLRVPDVGQARVEILEDEWQDQEVGRILPAPSLELGGEGPGAPPVQAYKEDEAAYSADSLSPDPPVRLAVAGWVRDARMALLTVFPYQYNPAAGVLRHHGRLRFRIRFEQPMDISRPDPSQAPQRSLVQGKATAAVQGGQAVQADASMAPPSPALKLLVEEEGVHVVTGRDLSRAGVPIRQVDVSGYRLFQGGQEVPLFIPAQEKGKARLGKNDIMAFYGEPNRSEFSRTNVYWLTWGNGTGLRMAVMEGTPAEGAQEPAAFLHTMHAERSYVYWYSMPNGEGDARKDNWFYWEFRTGGAYPATASADFDFTLNGLASSTEEVGLRVRFKDRVDPDRQHTRISLNGTVVDDRTWRPLPFHQGWIALSLAVPQSLLREGGNVLTIQAISDDPAKEGRFYLDWFEVENWRVFWASDLALAFSYQGKGRHVFRIPGFARKSRNRILAFDVTDPSSPKAFRNGRFQKGTYTNPDGRGVKSYAFSFGDQLDGAKRYQVLDWNRAASPRALQYYEAPHLRGSSNGADYIIVTARELEEAVRPLATYRGSRGLRVATVRVEEIYDEFSFGLKDPKAIRDFLRYAYENWVPPAPTYVLLVGDANIDYLQNYNPSNPVKPVANPRQDMVPTWILQSAALGDTPSDNRYVCVTTDEEGLYDPLPDMAIGRIPARSASEVTAVVNKILAYEADADPATWKRDILFVADQNEPTFEEVCEGLIADFLPTDFTPHRLYLSDYPDCNNTKCDSARLALQDEIAQGRLIANYVGHGYYYNWAGEMVLKNQDASILQNQGKLPFFATFTCMNGYYAWWDDECLAEKLLLEPQRAGIACFSPTQAGYLEDHIVLNRDLFEAIFQDGNNVLGLAVWAAKLKRPIPENLDFYTLFGDPALRLPMGSD